MLGFPSKGYFFFLFKCEMYTKDLLVTLASHSVWGCNGMFLDMEQTLHVLPKILVPILVS